MPLHPFIPFPNCVQVNMYFQDITTPWELTFGVRCPGPVTTTDLTVVGGGIDAWWASDLRALCSLDTVYVSNKVTDLTSQFAPTFITPNSGASNGSHSGGTLTAQAARVTTFRTAKRGRSFRGRSYLAGANINDLASAIAWSAGMVTAVEAAYVALSVALGVLSYTHVVLSRQENNVRRTTGVDTPVTQYVTRAPVATQRKRLV